MKHIATIGTILILVILTAGCLDDLSSTLPPCCDGTCNGVKTSVITVEHESVTFKNGNCAYITDSNGLKYTWDSTCPSYALDYNYRLYDPYNNHNVTFSYEMVNGHRHITGIIEDHDAKKPVGCCCSACCAGNCSCPREGCGI